LIALEGGASVIIVNREMDGQPSHPRIVPLIGRAGELMPAVLSLASG
jgi:hypothetical protein